MLRPHPVIRDLRLAREARSGYPSAPYRYLPICEGQPMNDRRNAASSIQPRPEPIALAEETLRNSATADVPAPKGEGFSTLWKVFGGTLLSIAALVAISLCQYFNGRLNALQADSSYQNTDLRKDLGRLCEAQTEFLKKDEFNTRLKSVWDGMKELQENAARLAVLKERATLTEQQLRAAEEERKALAIEVRQLREQRAADQERRELIRELQALRERLAALEGRKLEKTEKLKADGE
jgi:hypothetical protein